jgi:hypothetical protein
MVERLLPCAACARHVKSSDAACPFCGASMLGVASPATEPFRRMAAAAAVTAGVVALTGCSSSSSPSVSAYYGSAGITDAGPTNSDDAGDDGPSVVVFYGGPGIRDIDSGAGPGSATDASSDASESG